MRDFFRNPAGGKAGSIDGLNLFVGPCWAPTSAPRRPCSKAKGVPIADLQRLALTLAVWVTFVLLAELTPMRKPSASE